LLGNLLPYAFTIDMSVGFRPVNTSVIATFRASAAVWWRPPLFWDYKLRSSVVAYRRFGKAYLSHLQVTFLPLEDGTDRPVLKRR
jgi:hypothetical protein